MVDTPSQGAYTGSATRTHFSWRIHTTGPTKVEKAALRKGGSFSCSDLRTGCVLRRSKGGGGHIYRGRFACVGGLAKTSASWTRSALAVRRRPLCRGVRGSHSRAVRAASWSDRSDLDQGAGRYATAPRVQHSPLKGTPQPMAGRVPISLQELA